MTTVAVIAAVVALMQFAVVCWLSWRMGRSELARRFAISGGLLVRFAIAVVAFQAI